MAIRFKVVKGYERESVYMSHSRFFKLNLSKTYKKGSIVTSNPKLLGMMTFKRKYQAERWIRKNNEPDHKQQIIKVQTYGRGVTPKKLPDFSAIEEFLNILLRDSEEEIRYFHREMDIPKGTLCYHKLKVLT